MKTNLSRPVKIAAALCVLGLVYAAAEVFAPALQPGPSEDVVQACSNLAQAGLATDVISMAMNQSLKVQETGPELLVRLQEGCLCSLELSIEKVVKHGVLCKG